MWPHAVRPSKVWRIYAPQGLFAPSLQGGLRPRVAITASMQLRLPGGNAYRPGGAWRRGAVPGACAAGSVPVPTNRSLWVEAIPELGWLARCFVMCGVQFFVDRESREIVMCSSNATVLALGAWIY